MYTVCPLSAACKANNSLDSNSLTFTSILIYMLINSLVFLWHLYFLYPQHLVLILIYPEEISYMTEETPHSNDDASFLNISLSGKILFLSIYQLNNQIH